MNKDDKKKLAQAISDDLAKTKSQIVSLEKEAKPIAPDNSIGRLSRMEAINAQSVTVQNLQKARTRFHVLTQALEKLDEDDDFGMCEECGEPIPLKRLLLVPESKVCVACIRGTVP